jgi:hypothetical protein
MYDNFREEVRTISGGVIICVKNCIVFAELLVDENFEIIAVEVKARTLNIRGKL